MSASLRPQLRASDISAANSGWRSSSGGPGGGAIAARAAGAVPFEGPVTVVLTFDYDADETRVKVTPKPDGKATRPDVDNLCKLVMDALNGVAWKDDGQVAMLLAVKIEKKKRARTERSRRVA